MIKKTLKIIFLTDIHLQFQNVQQLRKWHNVNMISFDICLIGGDTSNCNQNQKTHNQQQMQKKSNKILKMVQQIFGCKVYFIPGNHDPLSYNQLNHSINQNIQSCHQKIIQIQQNLKLVGFGGSVPGYLDKQKTDQIWKGYPFDSNQQLQKKLKENLFFQGLQKDSQKIILTHVGPFDFQTSISRRNIDKPIYAGATYFNQILKRQDILIYLHGHVHDGSKYSKANNIPIINPGPLLYGEFAYILLQQNHDTKWQFKSSHFMKLDTKQIKK